MYSAASYLEGEKSLNGVLLGGFLGMALKSGWVKMDYLLSPRVDWLIKREDDRHADENELAEAKSLPNGTPYDMCLMTCLEKYDEVCKN